MKRLLQITLPLLFITSAVFPQSKANVNSLKEYGGKTFKVDDDEPYTGRVFDLSESTGKKTLQGQYKNGLKTGKWNSWYWNGKKELEVTYKDGKEEGKRTEWYFRNGQKKSEGTYKDGEQDGKYTEWRENGKKYYERTYKDDKKDGLETAWRENGQKWYKSNYKDGKMISEKYWNEDGSVRE